MQFRKSPIAIATVALFGALPLAAEAQSNYSGTPYTGTPVSLPASFAAVNFDKGGEGVGYHELSSANQGGLYRPSEAVDIFASTDRGWPYQIRTFQTGEWLNYTISVPANGTYDLGIRASNDWGPAVFHMEVDGVNVSGPISVPKTGSWSTYQWFGKKGVALGAGKHVVKLVTDTERFQVTALSMQTSATTSTGTTTALTGSIGSSGSASTPYTGTAIALPAAVAAVNFDKGGEGVAYHDLSSGNLGALYRTSEGVDIYASTDSASGPYQIANFQTGEWMKYTVNVPANGNYDLGVRAANKATTGAFHIEVDGVNVTGPVAVPNTGSWDKYQWFGKTGVALTAGTHAVRLVADQQWFNVSALSMLKSGTSTADGSTATKPANLLFWSGFEGTLSLSAPSGCYLKGCFQDLVGSDSSTGYSWPLKLQNGDSRFQLLAHSGTTSTPDTIGNYMYNELRDAVGPKGSQTKVLYTEVKQSGCCGTNAQGGGDTQDAFHVLPAAEPGDIYFSKWIKFQPDLAENLKNGDPWRVVFEWKEGNGDATGAAFRTVLGITFYDGSAPAWQVTWDNNANGGVPLQQFWRTYNKTVPVPIGEWFKLEVFWHRAKDNTGRIWYAVNGQVIDDHRGPTIGINDVPVGRIFINQVYSGASYPLYQWTDEVQMWKGWPTAKQGDAWYDPPYAPH